MGHELQHKSDTKALHSQTYKPRITQTSTLKTRSKFLISRDNTHAIVNTVSGAIWHITSQYTCCRVAGEAQGIMIYHYCCKL